MIEREILFSEISKKDNDDVDRVVLDALIEAGIIPGRFAWKLLPYMMRENWKADVTPSCAVAAALKIWQADISLFQSLPDPAFFDILQMHQLIFPDATPSLYPPQGGRGLLI